MKKQKQRILLVSDSPYSTTGLSRMVRYFLRMFPEIEWHVWGINHPHFFYSKNKYIPHLPEQKEFPEPTKLISPKYWTDDAFGFEMLPKFIEQVKPDILLTFHDLQRFAKVIEPIKKQSMTQGYKWIHYMNVDRYEFAAQEIELLKLIDIIVTTAKFGANQLKDQGFKGEIKTIYHPIDANEFPEVSNKDLKIFRKDYFGGQVKKENFLVGTVNRSFARKDPARLMIAFDKFAKDIPEAKMYFHGSARTVEGLDFNLVVNVMRLDAKKFLFPPRDYIETVGVSQEMLNKIYRSFDIFATASTGEGFGFSTVEALLCGIPVIAPNNTTFPEFLQEFGTLVDVSTWAYIYGLYDSPWRLANPEQFAEKLALIKNNYAEFKEKALKGREWVLKNLSLDNIKEQWEPILNS